jgi:hypothetical protein
MGEVGGIVSVQFTSTLKMVGRSFTVGEFATFVREAEKRGITNERTVRLIQHLGDQRDPTYWTIEVSA